MKLLFDRNREDVEDLVGNTKLEEDKNREIVTDINKPINMLIEGDNLLSLNHLLETHTNLVNLIYIDPPYRTQNKNFRYNDYFKTHDEWLSFMEKRLILAKEFLTDDGVIFISINDNEFAQLKLLCDEIFGEDNFIENFIWESIFRPSNMSKTTRKNAEYILCYRKTQNKLELVGEIQDTQGEASLTQNNNKKRILEFPKQYVHTNLEDGIYNKGIYGDYILHDNIVVRNGFILNTFKLEGKMKWTQEYLNSEINKGVFLIIKNKSMIPYYRKIYKQTRLRPTKILPKEIVKDVLSANVNLNNIFTNRVFDYPKPIALIKYLLTMINNKEAIVLDFFAGSGTTGHAVLELNKEDNGNRQFILCTNNENNICEEVTYQRINKVINGYTTPKGKEVEGLGGNLKYYKVTN